MNRFYLGFFIFICAAFSTQAADPAPFKVYAPSRNGQELLVLQVMPSKEDKFPFAELELINSDDLGFGGRTIAQHPTKPILYISGGAGKDDTMNFSWKRLNPETNRIASGNSGDWPRDYSYLSVDRNGKFLLGCNYGSGIIDVYALDEKGNPNPVPVTTLNEGRKAAHCALLTPDNRHLYIPYVKDNNALFQYAFDGKSGTPTALDQKNANPPEGTGPRHLAYHPKLPILYFSEEQGLGVSIYDRDVKSGKLTYSKSVSSVPDTAPEEGVSASDIVITPNGKFLFTGIRGHKHDFDFIAGYAVLEDGDLKPLGLTKTSKIPWGLAVSPDGNFLVVTAFKGAEIILYRIQPDGSLKKGASLPVDEGISDVETR